MSILEITSVSSKGQVVIPNSIREKMELNTGSKLIVIQDGENILLKPISVPKKKQFKKIIDLGDKARKELGLKPTDVKSVIKKVRKANMPSHVVAKV